MKKLQTEQEPLEEVITKDTKPIDIYIVSDKTLQIQNGDIAYQQGQEIPFNEELFKNGYIIKKQ